MKLCLSTWTVIFLISTLISCDRDGNNNLLEEMALPPTDCWTEIEDDSFIQFAGSNHIFCFLSGTEFTLELERWTDVVSDINAPNNSFEYIKGTYVWANDSFEIAGSYMDSDYINFVSNPAGETDYTKTYEVKVISDKEMILDDKDNYPNRRIRLVQ